MTEIEQLLAVEEIKSLKARYFYHLDQKDWAGWKRDVFAPDASLHVPEAQAEPVAGVDNIIAWVSSLPNDVSVHHGHMPDIEVLSDSTARGIWAMEDRLYRSPENPFPGGGTYLHGFGHYHETYVRLATGWRINTSRLVRLRVETHVL